MSNDADAAIVLCWIFTTLLGVAIGVIVGKAITHSAKAKADAQSSSVPDRDDEHV